MLSRHKTRMASFHEANVFRLNDLNGFLRVKPQMNQLVTVGQQVTWLNIWNRLFDPLLHDFSLLCPVQNCELFPNIFQVILTERVIGLCLEALCGMSSFRKPLRVLHQGVRGEVTGHLFTKPILHCFATFLDGILCFCSFGDLSTFPPLRESRRRFCIGDNCRGLLSGVSFALSLLRVVSRIFRIQVGFCCFLLLGALLTFLSLCQPTVFRRR
mmetsp:Transcript_2062/g.5438  ORF Transcript_2062/g.5438 Transcript_2062/m.5438 type:complete len:213 (-) Transcript_2062:46-684(-)